MAPALGARFTAADVTIRTVHPISVACMAHRGDRATIGDTISRFVSWRQASGLSPRTSPTFNVFRTDPSVTPPAEQLMELCVGVERPMTGDGVEPGTIPGGRCAMLRIVGCTDLLEPAADFLVREWLPNSGEAMGDFPPYCQRLSFPPEVPAHQAVTELFLPLK